LRQQAKGPGLDEGKYMEAVKLIPLWDNEKLTMVNKVLRTFLDLLIRAGEQRLIESESQKEIVYSEEKYHTLFDTMKQGVFYQAADGDLIDANAAALDMFGLTKNQLLSRTSYTPEWSVIDKDGRPLSPDKHPSMVALLTGKPVTDYILAVYNYRDKKYIWMNVNAIPQFNDNSGKPTRVMVTLHDITKQVNTEDELRRSENKYRQLVEHFPEGIMVHVDGKFVYANESALKIFAAGNISDILGKNVLDFVDPVNKNTVTIRIEQVTNKRHIAPLKEERLLKVDGTGFIGEVIATPISYYDRPAVQLMVKDITDRKQWEEAIQRSEQKLKAYFNNTGDSIYIIDATTGKIIDCNLHACKSTGYKKEEITLMTFHDIESRNNFDDIKREYRKSPAKENLVEGIHRRKDGSLFPVEIRLKHIPASDPPLLLSIFRDISVREELQAGKMLQSEITRNIMEGIYMVRPNDLVIVYANPIMEKMFGYKKGELIGKTVSIINSPDGGNPDKTARQIELSLKKRGIYRGEVLSRRKDGTPFWTYSVISMMKHPDYGDVYLSLQSDISEIKETEQALRESQEKLDLALRSAEMGVWYFDISRNKRVFDKQCCHLLGLDPETYNGSDKEFMSVVHPEDLAALRQQVHDTIKQRKTFSPEYRVILKDGSVIYIKARGKLIVGDDNKPSGILGILWDITDRIKNEEEILEKERNIKESEEKFRAIFYSVDSGIIYMTKSGKVVDINPAFRKLFAIEKKDLVGMNIQKVARKMLNHSDSDKILKIIEKLIKGESIYGFQFEWKEHHLSGSAFISAETDMLIGVISDLTEQKKAEKQRLELLLRQEAILGTVPDIIMEINTDRIYTWANEAGYEFFGTDVIGKPVSHYSMNNSKLNNKFKPLFDGSVQSMYIETRQRRKDDEIRLLGWWYRPLTDMSGNVTGAISSAMDLTEIKDYEIELERSKEQLEQLNKYLQNIREEERKRIARELHDELGQALTAVKIDLSAIDHSAGTNADIHKRLHKVVSLVNNSLHTVKRLTFELRPHILDDLGLLAALEWYTEEYSKRTGINIALNMCAMPAFPSETELVIFRIVQESLTNVIRHSKAKNINIECTNNNKKLELKIIDDGIGISFENLRSRKSFGLLNMKERAKEIGAVLRIESTQEQGTTIIMNIDY
ncbi:MAG TPA: PAS domain S-box protein, partial [Bacteroidales bacterium]|nr:PAS domain S-box protein [Bacteroidales bacterium]